MAVLISFHCSNMKESDISEQYVMCISLNGQYFHGTICNCIPLLPHTQDILMAKQEAFLNISAVLVLPVGHIFTYTCFCLRKKGLSALLNSFQFNKLTWSH